MKRICRRLAIAAAALSIGVAAAFAQNAAVKAPLAGLVDMGDIGFHRVDGGVAKNDLAPMRRVPGIFAGAVINVAWGQIEPTRGALDTSEIDRSLAEMRAYNRENPAHPLGARLRVFTGPNAPPWAKELGGAPVHVLHLELPITIGHFWDKPYREAWRDLQKRLAAKYDGEPLIREVTNTSTATITDEGFIVAGDAASIKNMLAAGYTDAQSKAALADSCDDYAGWTTTNIEWPCSPFREIDSGKAVPMPDYTAQMMDLWRKKLGRRGVLGNHSLSHPEAPQLVYIYDKLRALGPPTAVQTHSPNGLDWEGVIADAAAEKITSVELWRGTRFGGYETKDPTTLQRWADMMANAAK